MKKIEVIEKVLNKEITFEEANVNHTILCAYRATQRGKIETLNFSDVIWDRDIPEIIKFCKEHEIKEITITSTFSGLLETLEIFADYGCEIVGLTKVTYVEWDDEIKKVPGMKIRMPR
jgi:hypothetical protein